MIIFLVLVGLEFFRFSLGKFDSLKSLVILLDEGDSEYIFYFDGSSEGILYFGKKLFLI